MKTLFHLLLVSLLVFLASASNVDAQQRIYSDHDYHRDIYEQIERAYEEGQLTLNQKVLYKYNVGNSPYKLSSGYLAEDTAPAKCGTAAILDFQKNRAKLSHSTIAEIESTLETQISASETYISPSGRFRIHYETSGSHAVPNTDSTNNNIPDYVELVAAAADSSYRHQVQTLGYTNPIPTGQTYDIEIRNLEVFYGDTRPSGNTTIIRIENDFSEGFPPNSHPDGHQIGAINATVAHEFKHAIQYTATRWSGETVNWLEMDATLMEEVVYDDVNDYYNYLDSENSIFNNPEQSFYPGSYYHVTWALFFEEKYGSDFWPQVWEIIKQNPTGTSMVEALSQQLGGTEAFQGAYTESQLWHYASGPENSSPEYGFEESAEYPAPPIEREESLYDKNFTIPRSALKSGPENFAAKYYNILFPENTEGNIQLETSSQGNQKGVGIIAYYQNGRVEASTFSLSANEASFKMPDLSWNNIGRLGIVLTNSSTIPSGESDSLFVGVGTDSFDNTLSHNYPNPFNPQTRIRFTIKQASHVELKVYDSAGRLITTLVNEELSPGLYEPVFDGSSLASGIYFYQLITDQHIQTQQMTLIK